MDALCGSGKFGSKFWVLGVLLWCISWADLFYSFHGLVHGRAPAPVFFVTPLVVGVTMLLATLLIQYERLQGVQSSGVLIIFWFLCVVCAIIPFRSKILSAKAEGEISDPFRFTTFYIYFALVLSALILACFREKPPLFSAKNVDPNPYPETSAGFLSRLFFWWFTKMAIHGYRHPLEEKDLWSLKEEDRSQMVVQQLLEAWRKQQKQTARHKAAAAPGEKASSEDEVLLGTQPRPRQPSFLQALLTTFGSSLLISACFKLIQDLLSFINPQLLSVLIRFISNPMAPSWWGFLVAGLMFLCSMMQSLILQQYYHCIFVTGLKFRTGIIGVIYRKALVITNSVKRASTVGEIVNLMSVDAQRFMDLVPFLNLLWSAPLQIILAMYFLWQNLGPSVLAGVALMVLLIPLNGAVAMKMRAFQVEQMKLKDSRIKLMSEILNGIKVLKLYAWEPSFLQQVEGIRLRELQLLRKAAYLHAISTFIWVCSPFLVRLSTGLGPCLWGSGCPGMARAQWTPP
uniref:ATP binding cassette subfamily C member 3 n=1 Tax=Saimiri boliviensis boliviensis TaxID=39432 RepID=A0A2K6UWG7_SAIBB